MANFCNKCGAKVNPEQLFCRACGQRLTPEVAEDRQDPLMELKNCPQCGGRLFVNEGATAGSKVLFCTKCKDVTDIVQAHQRKMQQQPYSSELQAVQTGSSLQVNKTPGIVVLVIGAVLGLWVHSRITSFAGQFYTWLPPYSGYELPVVIVGWVAAIMVIIGLANILKKAT